MGLSSSEDPMIVEIRSLSRFDSVPACDGRTVGRTDGQTDGFTMANTALCIASYADTL